MAGHEGLSSAQDLIWLKQQGILSLGRLIGYGEAEVNAEQIKKAKLWDCHEPVLDFGVPKPDQIERIIQFIDSSISSGRPVGVSCRFGLGRTGTILACYLVRYGLGANTDIDEVRNKRPGSVETLKQEDAVRSYAFKL